MIYFDNAATSFPKPDIILEKTFEFAKNSCANPGRSAHNLSIKSSMVVYEARRKIADFFNIKDELKIIFTKNCSEALNIGLFSVVKKGDHVISSVFEHNSVVRVLEHMKKTLDIQITYLKPNDNLVITKDMVQENIKPNTSLIALNHANNLVGTFNDIEDIGKLANENNIIFLVDAAQSAGKSIIDVQKMNIDILCAPGHKSLYGLSGTGFIYASEKVKLKPIIYGGTGSFSDEVSQPDILPDALETGTLNVVGIKSLLEGITYINEIGIENIIKKEEFLTNYILEKMSDIKEVILYTPVYEKINNLKNIERRKNHNLAGIISFNIRNMDSSFVAGKLNSDYDIATRGGLHCNPLGHRFLGTIKSGFIRASIGYFNTTKEADVFINAIKEIIKEN